MSQKSIKKRNFLMDVILLTAIFSVFLAVIFITFFHSNEEAVKSGQTNTFKIPKSETSQSDSPFKNIKIITDVSNDDYAPFATQYPYTAHENINEVITKFIDDEKNTYIQKMRVKKDDIKVDASGELNISFEIFPYNEDFYSFLIKKVQSLPNEKTTESYTTYFFNNVDGELSSFKHLLKDNKESLKSVASHVYASLKDDDRYKQLAKEDAKDVMHSKWGNFTHFTIQDEMINLYFNSLVEPKANTPLNVAIPLTAINPLLSEEFQIPMQPSEQQEGSSNESRKLVALTFDDGPNPDVTPRILELLEKYHAKATFFMLGSRVQYYPDIVKNVFERGHEIGNHTWNHPLLTKMTEAQIIKEYSTTEQAIIQAIGVPSTVFRPPYGATNSLVENTIDSLQVNWTIDTLDWKYRSASKLLPSVESAMHNNAIILMHDIHKSTADGLENVLKFLQSSGYECVTVSEIMKNK